ncbi:MAG: FadR/GntR family transcriptional regulator [Devosia sp.]
MKPKLSYAGLHAQILEKLGKDITSGAYPEGSLLPREAELQEHFKASRQTVREAIKVLTTKGMVYARKRAGTFVQPRSSWDLLDPDVLAWHPLGELPHDVLADFVEMRRLIEPAAAGFAASRGGVQEVQRIKDALSMMSASVGDSEHFYEADIEFHMAIFAASHNRVIGRMSAILRPLLAASFRLQREANVMRGLRDGYGVHEAVYTAIARKDSEGASLAMKHLLDRALTEI